MNWGKKLMIGMALFMVFIMSMGAIMIMRNESDSLIDNNYYEKGQRYDEDYNAKQAAVDDMVVPVVVINKFGLTITFPVPVKYQLTCRRPSDYHLDKMFNGFTDEDRNIIIQKGELKRGPWLLRIKYTANNKTYLFECEVDMP